MKKSVDAYQEPTDNISLTNILSQFCRTCNALVLKNYSYKFRIAFSGLVDMVEPFHLTISDWTLKMELIKMEPLSDVATLEILMVIIVKRGIKSGTFAMFD